MMAHRELAHNRRPSSHTEQSGPDAACAPSPSQYLDTVTHSKSVSTRTLQHSYLLMFVLHRMVKGANATIFLCCVLSLLFSSAIVFVSCRSLPFCGCYDATTGLESLVPQGDPGDTELVWTWRAADDERLFNSPAKSSEPSRVKEDQSQAPPTLAPYRRLT